MNDYGFPVLQPGLKEKYEQQERRFS